MDNILDIGIACALGVMVVTLGSPLTAAGERSECWSAQPSS